MISIQIIIAILIFHWIGDFLFQTNWQAKNKATDLGALIDHTLTYSTVLTLCGICMFHTEEFPLNWLKIGLFVGITFLAHTLTDYFTSKLNKHLWDTKQVHYFFVSIGFDQVLHYIQLTLTYLLLK